MRRTLVTLAVALALLSGCGGDKDSGDGVATAGDPSSTASSGTDSGNTTEAAAKFAQCMRDNGVEMEDPDVDGDGKVTFGQPEGGSEPQDREKVQAAQEKCKQYLPNGGEPPTLSAEDLDKLRKFSQCMRENGYPDFPDPQPDGGIRIEGDQNSDMDPESEKWKEAHKKCEQYMPERKEGGQAGNTGGGS